MDESTQRFWQELIAHCEASQTDEFEYYWEIWGVNWYPWTIEIGKMPWPDFTDREDPDKKLDWLEAQGMIVTVKEYAREEMRDEFNRKRYRIVRKTFGV